MNRRKILAAIAALFAKYVIPPSALAQDKTLVHGIVVDESGAGVPGGVITVWKKVWPGWDEGASKTLQSNSWQLYLGNGTFKIRYLQNGWALKEVIPAEFLLPDDAPIGDVRIVVQRATPVPVPTETLQPTATHTVNVTITPQPSRTAKPCLDFQQFDWIERRGIIMAAAMRIGLPLEIGLDFDNDLTLLFGLRDMMLGAPLTMRFIVDGFVCRAFAQAIIVMRVGEPAREECVPYGVVGWDGTQNWAPD